MKISFNPSNSNKNILDLIKNNKDIIFDLKGHSIFARGVEFKGTDTNTWRDIKINNVSIGSHTLDLRNGSNTTLTNTNGVVTINSTWRPVVDNLTSDSTTSSLSAKQGKVLKALIDGKSNSDHNHDGRYVRYYAVTTLDCNNLAAGLTAARISATNAAHTNHSAYLYISDVETPFQIQIPDSSIPYIYKRYYGSGTWSGWFKLSAGYADSAGSVAWNNVTGKPSEFNPADHTHTVFKNNLMIKGTNGVSDSASIHLGIGDSDTGFKWISDGVCQIYANNIAVGQWTSGGMNWFKNPTVNGNEVWNAGNDGSGSGLDADTLDGYHASAFSYKSWWHWYDKDGQPNWLWGGNNENDYYIYNPSNFRVAYAASAGNADTLDGYPANGYSDRPYGHIPTIESDGVMEVGRHIDFHNDNNGNCDYSTRLQSTGNYGNKVNLPSASGTLALINDVNNYYWANVKISTSSSTTTSPTFSNVYLGHSLQLNNRGPNSIYNGPNDSAYGVGGPLNNLVFSSWLGVSFTTSCAGMTYTNKSAVSINCRTGQLYAREVQANGFMHTGHNNNDAVLLAGGGYKTLKDFIFLNKSYNYTDNEHYNLAFHKLSGICNNLVWVDGHVKGFVSKVFVIDPAVFPYRYDQDPALNTIYRMNGSNNFITINASGGVTINNATDHKERVGFFYVGRA